MRKLNAIITVLIIILFIDHGIMGGFLLTGLGTPNIIIGGYIMMAIVLVHVIIGVKLTIDTISAQKKSGTWYPKENRLFWARRISGFAVIIFLAFHMMAFGAGRGDIARLGEFTTFKMITQVLMVITIGIHIISNVRPMLITLGIKKLKPIHKDILWILSIILLFMAVAFFIYYIRWNTI